MLTVDLVVRRRFVPARGCSESSQARGARRLDEGNAPRDDQLFIGLLAYLSAIFRPHDASPTE